MSDNQKAAEAAKLKPSIEHTPYSEQTQQYADTIKQKYDEFNTKFQEPHVQEKWAETKTILFQRTKEFGFLTFDYFLKSFQITKTTATDLYNVYKK